ncbi:hypothetical protein MNBD_GAMMA09-3872 [hydrothermal vent metagenome]|uniref:Uncharacterized protein n=1 Tax=hydrothermal vent metagenome TaxID=652676 RepID=A0A3B0X1N8_9ZZZZ
MTFSTAQAEPEKETFQLPSVVGPYLYEIYTDAKFFITHVYVNGSALKLSNAEGSGMIMGGGFSYSGPTGYRNNVRINGYMRAGKNEIKIVFEPSSIVEKAQKENKLNIVLEDMFAHVVLVRGELLSNDMGLTTAELTEKVKEVGDQVDVLVNENLTEFSLEKLSKEVSVTYQLTLRGDEMAVEVPFTHCNYGWSMVEKEFIGTLKLNSEPYLAINGSGASGLANLSDLLKQGENKFELTVDKFKDEGVSEAFMHKIKGRKPFPFRFYLRSNLEQAIKSVGFPPELSGLRYGSFFNESELLLGEVEVVGVGDYSFTLDMNITPDTEEKGRCKNQLLTYDFSDEQLRQLRRDWGDLYEAQAYYELGEDEAAEQSLKKVVVAKGNISCEKLGMLHAFCWQHIKQRSVANKMTAVVRKIIQSQ